MILNGKVYVDGKEVRSVSSAELRIRGASADRVDIDDPYMVPRRGAQRLVIFDERARFGNDLLESVMSAIQAGMGGGAPIVRIPDPDREVFRLLRNASSERYPRIVLHPLTATDRSYQLPEASTPSLGPGPDYNWWARVREGIAVRDHQNSGLRGRATRARAPAVTRRCSPGLQQTRGVGVGKVSRRARRRCGR